VQIQQAFKTSKGIFLSKEVADKRENRQKETDGRTGEFVCFEEPIEVYVIYSHGKFFQLQEVDIKF